MFALISIIKICSSAKEDKYKSGCTEIETNLEIYTTYELNRIVRKYITYINTTLGKGVSFNSHSKYIFIYVHVSCIL